MKKTVLAILCLFMAIPAFARTITINADGSGDYTTIQAAINDANDDDVIVLNPGTYTGDGNRDIDYLGKAITVRSTDPNDPNIVAITVIDCNSSESRRHRGFYFHSEEDANSVLSGLTIINGYSWQGGGIYCRKSSPTISKCVLTSITTFGRVTGGGAGAIFCYMASPVIISCKIVGNSSSSPRGYGGGIACERSSPKIINCIIASNSAHNGGGIYSERSSHPEIINCTIVNNSAFDHDWFGPALYGRGGAIYSENESRVTIKNSVIWGNGRVELFGICFDISHSNIEDFWPGVGNINEDPGFVDANNGNYRLLADSPCIDSGKNDYIGALTETDIETNQRIIDTDNDGNAVVDMGAYELPSVQLPYIRHYPRRFVFWAFQSGPAPCDQNLYIYNTNRSKLKWKVDEDCNWLNVSPVKGRLSGQKARISLSVDASAPGLGRVNHTQLKITSNKACNNPLIIPVSFYIFDDDSLIVPHHYPNVQEAIDSAQDGQKVIIYPGRYIGVGNYDIKFKGKAITVQSIDPNDPDIVASTIIDFNNSPWGDTYFGGFQFRHNEGPNSVLAGLTIEKFFDEGVLCHYSSPTITNCVIKDGTWSHASGIVFYNSPDAAGPVVKNCVIEYCGNGVRCRSNVVFENCLISNNSWGGGFYCENSILKFADCTISDNYSSGDDVEYGQRYGGGLHLRNCDASLLRCTIKNNTAQYSGGGLYVRDSDCYIQDCRITGNSSLFTPLCCYPSGGEGGGIYSRDSNTLVSNSLIVGNNTDSEFLSPWGGPGRGGGIYCRSGDLTIENSSIIDNSSYSANCIYFGGDDANIINSILWNNNPQDLPVVSVGYRSSLSSLSISFSDILGGIDGIYAGQNSTVNFGPGNINSDPCFANSGYWADYQDPNIIVEPNDPNAFWIDGDYHLFEDSLCINTGDPNYPNDPNYDPNEKDLDGNPRIINSRIDMGAYEFIDPLDLLIELSESIDAMDLPKGISNSLQAKLDTAMQKLEDGNENNDIAAINLLQAFINAVEAQRGKKISQEDADYLIAAAQQIIDMLNSE